MVCEQTVRRIGVILCMVLSAGVLARAQSTAGEKAALPDILPSTVISDGAASFRLSDAAEGFNSPETSAHTASTARQMDQESFVTRVAKRGLQDQKDIWTAPFHRSHAKWDLLFLAGTGTLVAVDEQVLHALPNTQVSTSSTVSNGLIVAEGAALGGLFFIHGLHGGDSHAKETGILGIESLTNAFLVYVPLQIAAGRERPKEGTGEGSFFANHSLNTSFPGGHSMFAFTMATVIAHEYPRWWVQLLSYGAASAITGARMTAKMHFPSDLLVGGALGYMIGTHIFHAHCNPDLGGDCHASDKEAP
jgi:hypothetical protein